MANCDVKDAHAEANTFQVDGNHYQSEYQHWDMIEDHGIGYLEAAATKYVTRWRTKDGIKDLQKALHYTMKLIEKHNTRHRLPRGIVLGDKLALFSKANNLGPREELIITILCTWRTGSDLAIATREIETLLKGEIR